MSLPPGSGRLAAGLLRRPDLWPVAARTALALAAPGWWRRWPFLPAPDPAYWRMRMTVAYGGDGSARPEVRDVVDYLEWVRSDCRRTRRMRG